MALILVPLGWASATLRCASSGLGSRAPIFFGAQGGAYCRPIDLGTRSIRGDWRDLLQDDRLRTGRLGAHRIVTGCTSRGSGAELRRSMKLPNISRRRPRQAAQAPTRERRRTRRHSRQPQPCAWLDRGNCRGCGRRHSALNSYRSAPSSQWMTSASINGVRHLGQKGFYPHQVEGECQSGGEKFRADWRAIRRAPLSPHHGMTRRDYERREQEYRSRGYALETVNISRIARVPTDTSNLAQAMIGIRRSSILCARIL